MVCLIMLVLHVILITAFMYHANKLSHHLQIFFHNIAEG